MNMKPSQLERLVGAAIQLGVLIALVRSAQVKPYLKKSEAYRIYGRRNVQRWMTAGLLTPRKDGDYSAAWRIDRIEIETLSKAQEMESCLSEQSAGQP